MLGYPPEEAYRLLNPLAWALRLIRCLRYSTQHLYGHWFGHSRVILRDVNDYGDSITLVRSLSGKAFVVRCEICFIMEITHRTVSQKYAQRVYTALRDEVWRLEKDYRENRKNADALDSFLVALDDLAARFQR
ncbi:hypothetical protein, partial [Comamonas terrigena]